MGFELTAVFVNQCAMALHFPFEKLSTISLSIGELPNPKPMRFPRSILTYRHISFTVNQPPFSMPHVVQEVPFVQGISNKSPFSLAFVCAFEPLSSVAVTVGVEFCRSVFNRAEKRNKIASKLEPTYFRSDFHHNRIFNKLA